MCPQEHNRCPALFGTLVAGVNEMTITVKIGEAKTHLSQLLAKVEAGEEVIIQRGHEPVARLSRVRRSKDVERVIAEMRTGRQRAKPVTTEEILAWRHEGHRY